MTRSGKISIGTRASPLALYQAGHIKERIERLRPDLEVRLVRIKTTGDKITDVPLARVGGKGLFVKEIEEALLDGRIDLAVHSMKDVPAVLPPGLHLAVIPEREDPRDALIGRNGVRFGDLPLGSVVGTSSLRRQAQLRVLRSDLKIEPLRGNLDTRLRKLESGSFAAIILAAAGLKRLGMTDKITEYLDPAVSLPAIGQGALGLECRREDGPVNELLAPLDHPDTHWCVKAERAFLARLEGGCQVPIAGHARLENGGLILEGLVASVAGDRVVRDRASGPVSEAETLGVGLAESLLTRGAGKILDEVYRNS